MRDLISGKQQTLFQFLSHLFSPLGPFSFEEIKFVFVNWFMIPTQCVSAFSLQKQMTQSEVHTMLRSKNIEEEN